MVLIGQNHGIIIKHQTTRSVGFMLHKLCMSWAFIFHGKIALLFPQCIVYIILYVCGYDNESGILNIPLFNKATFQKQIQCFSLKL